VDGDLIPVRVTVNQAGAREGQVRWVNADDPAIAERLALGYLVRLPLPGEEAEPEPNEEQPGGDEDDATEDQTAL